MKGQSNAPQIQALEQRRLLATDILADVRGIYPTDAVQVDGISYFAADDGVHGRELWKSDGTEAGTALVADLAVGASSSNPTYLVALDGAVLFLAKKADGSVGLYRANASGASLLRDMGQGRIAGMAVLGDKAIFVIRHADKAVKMWGSDGTAGGTSLIKQLSTDHVDFVSVFTIKALGNRLLFLDQGSGNLFSTNGTTAGTVQLGVDSAGRMVRTLEILDDEGFFLAHSTVVDDDGNDISSYELWRTDGTPQGTSIIKSISGGGTGLFATTPDTLFFVPAPELKMELWVSDGTDQGTKLLMPMPQERDAIYDLTVLPDGRAFFLIGDLDEQDDLTAWVTDGTVAGTSPIKVLGPGLRGGLGVHVGGIYYFLAFEGLVGYQLWRTDGTSAGTAMIQDFAPAGGLQTAVRNTEVDGKVVITHGNETYVYDATTTAAPVGPNQGRTTLTDRVLRVFGTNQADSIRIYRMADNPDRFVVNLNGVKRSFAFADVRKLIVYGYSGDDNIAFSEINGVVAIRSMIQAGAGDDTIYGSSTRDSVWGQDGNDFIHTSIANDEAFGGSGDDTLMGMAGDDTLMGEEGADSVIGGAHQDVISGGFDQSDDTLDGGGSADVIFGTAVFEIFFGGQEGGDPLDDVLLA